MENMIKKEDAKRFIEDKLKIENFEAKVKDSRNNLLSEVMRALQAEVPFHNLWLLKNPHMPSEEEVLEDSLNMKGGLCFHFNYFIFHLLKALGYEVYLIYGTYSASPFPEAHMACIVKNMEYEGSRHLVDIGGYPMFEAVSLLDLPKVYVYTGRKVMFTKSAAKGRFIRWHSKKDVVVANEVQDPTVEGEWCKIFDYNDKEVDYAHFREFTYPIFTDFHPENRLLHNLYLTRYPGRQSATISIIGRRLFKTTDSGFGTVSLLKKGELYPTVRKYFPEISEDDLNIAIKKTERYLDGDKMNSWLSITLALLSYVWYIAYYFVLKSSFKRVVFGSLPSITFILFVSIFISFLC